MTFAFGLKNWNRQLQPRRLRQNQGSWAEAFHEDTIEVSRRAGGRGETGWRGSAVNLKARLDRIAASVAEMRRAQQLPAFLDGMARFRMRAREALEELDVEMAVDKDDPNYPPSRNPGGSIRAQLEEGAAVETAVRDAHPDWTRNEVCAELWRLYRLESGDDVSAEVPTVGDTEIQAENDGVK